MDKDYEVIYVDDGSKDDSLKILRHMRSKDKRIRILGLDKNYGQTSALHAGFYAARGNFIVTLDADLQYDPGDIIKIIKGLEGADVVISYRTNRRAIDGYIKDASSMIARWIRNKLLREDFKDAGSFRGFRKTCLKRTMLYKGLQVFIPSLLQMQGFRIREIPVRVYPRKYGKSKYGIKNRLFRQLRTLLAVKWMKDNLIKYKVKEEV